MRLISDRQLTGIYGTVAPYEEFDCPDDDVARQLIQSGLAHKAESPKILYDTKVIAPPEVGPAIPFRDVPVPDAKPPAVAAAGDPVLPEPNLSEPGAADSRRRRGRFSIDRK